MHKVTNSEQMLIVSEMEVSLNKLIKKQIQGQNAEGQNWSWKKRLSGNIETMLFLMEISPLARSLEANASEICLSGKKVHMHGGIVHNCQLINRIKFRYCDDLPIEKIEVFLRLSYISVYQLNVNFLMQWCQTHFI